MPPSQPVCPSVAHPEVELVRNGGTVARVAHLDDSLQTRRAIDRVFAAKYGLTDSWYGALLRRSPVPIRLDPVPSSHRDALPHARDVDGRRA
jgi:hypothetical protein